MLDDLKRRYHFADWQGINTLPLHLLLWRYRLRGTELPGWQVRSARLLALSQAVRLQPTLWQRPFAGRSDPLRVDAYEYSWRDAAHEGLLRLLGEFTRPDLSRIVDAELGDIGFASPDARAVLFARANLVFLLAAPGAALPTTLPLARSLDLDLITQPPPRPGSQAMLAATAARTAIAPRERVRGAIGKGVPLVPKPVAPRAAAALGGAAAPAVELQYKLYSSGCELHADDEQVHAVPLVAGAQKVEIYTLAPGEAWSRVEVGIDVVAG